jgi:hypothetical protein
MPPGDIVIEMKMGILHTVAKSIYSSQEGKFREAIANANDNEAEKVLIYTDQASMRVSLFDNGTGISKEKYEQIFQSFGVGLDKSNPSKLSYFGLGLMSVLQLGNKATIVSKPKNGDITVLNVNVAKIFDEKNEGEKIDFLAGCMIFEKFSQRSDYSSLPDNVIEEVFSIFPNSFTEIIIEELTVKDFEKITSEMFITELTKILPLKLKDNEPFIENIVDIGAKNKIIGLFKSNYCPTIEVHLGSDEGFTQQLFKCFPKFKSDIFFRDSNIVVEEKDSFAMYMIFAAEGLEEDSKAISETGFWVRNQNFLVKRSDYFSQPGKRSKLLSAPTRNWVFGEILHRNMNDFLVASRDDYNWESEEFLKFQQSIVDITARLDKELRKIWDASNKIVKSVIDPFLAMDTAKGPFEKAYSTLSTFGAISEAKDADEILGRIQENHGTDLHDANRLDQLFDNNIEDELILADDSDGTGIVIIDKALKGKKIPYEKSFDIETGRIKIIISPDLFNPKDVTFLGKKFNVVYVVGTELNQAINVNLSAGEIRINPFNHQMLKYSVSFIDVYVAIEIAHAKSNGSVLVMKDYLYLLLGRTYKDTSKYLGTLSDDLSRFNRSKR